MRHAIGVFAIGLLVCGFSLRSATFADQAIVKACMKVGLLLAITWLAYPQLLELAGKTPRWALVAVGIFAIVAVVFQQKAKFLLPIVMAIAALYFAGRWLRRPAAR